MGAIFGDGGAKRAAQKSRELQAIANDRQLAELKSDDTRSGATRRNPRGRRLFVTDAAQKKDLS